MKESEVSKSDLKSMLVVIDGLKSDQSAGLSKKEVKILDLLTEGIQEPHDLARHLGITANSARIQKHRLLARIRVRLHDLQNAEGTETAQSGAMPERIEMAMSLPPKNAEFFLALFLNKGDQEVAMGCFAELYGRRVARWGNRRARVWAWIEVGKIVAPILKKAVIKGKWAGCCLRVAKASHAVKEYL